MRKIFEVPMFKSLSSPFRWRTLTALGLALAFTMALSAAPAWMSRMNYQGQLTDSAGNAVADGAYSIQFLIYDNATGGTLLWSETQPTVQVSKGLFNVILGSVVSLNSAFSGTNTQNDMWIAVKVGADAEMTPRQSVLSTVFAQSAHRLDGYGIGTSANNIVQLDGSGKIPASLIAAGSVNVPLDMTGAGGAYALHVNNTTAAGKGIIAEGTDIAVSATSSSTASPAVYAEGSRYGASVKTNDNAAGVALQAFGPSGAYASLIDRVNNAQVYGAAASAANYGLLGVNTNGSGVAVGGNSAYIGVSGSGGTYGVYGQGANTGVYGNGTSFGVQGQGGSYGVYGFSSSNYGVYGNSGYTGVLANGTTYGLDAGGSVGAYGHTTTNGGKGVWGAYNAAGVGSGVKGDNASATGYGVYGQSTPATGLNAGVRGEAASTAGYGVWGLGQTGVFGSNTLANGDGIAGTTNQVTSEGLYAENTAVGAGATAALISSTAASAGVGVRVLGGSNGYGVSASASTAVAGYGSNYGVYGAGANAGVEGYSTTWGVEGQSTYGGIIGRGLGSGTTYGVLGSAGGSSGSGGYFESTSNGSADGIYSYTNSTSGGAGGNFAAQGGSGVIYGVKTTTNSPAGYAVNAINSSTGSPAIGGYIEGGGIALSVTSHTSGGYGVKTGAYYPFYALGANGGYNFYSDTTNNPYAGFYHYGYPTTGSYGIYDVHVNTTGHAAFIFNIGPTAADSGDALYVRGKIRATDCAGRVNFTNGVAQSTWVVNSTYLGTYTLASLEAGSVVMVQLISPTVGYPLMVSSVSAGTSFTLTCATTITNLNFYYWIVNK